MHSLASFRVGRAPPLPLAVLGQNSIAMAVTNITPPQIRTSVTGSGLTLCSVPRVARRRLHQPQQAGRQLLSPKRRLVTHSTSGRRRGTHNETPGNPTNQTQPPPPYHRRPNRRAGSRAPLLALPPPWWGHGSQNDMMMRQFHEFVSRRHRPAACHSRGTTGGHAPLPRPPRIPT